MTDGGAVNEDVFAYSNRAGGDRALVVYHNRYASASGAIRESVPYVERGGDGTGRRMARQSLADALGLHEPGGWLRFRDEANGVEYLRAVDDLQERGLPLLLGAYQRHVFLDFREIPAAAAEPYRRLAQRLGGRGVASVDEALRELVLEPVRAPFARIVSSERATQLAEIAAAARQGAPPSTGERPVARSRPRADEATAPLSDQPSDEATPPPAPEQPLPTEALLERLTGDARDLGAAVHELLGDAGEPVPVDDFAASVRRGVSTGLALAADDRPDALPTPDASTWLGVLAWLGARGLGGVASIPERGRRSRQRVREWRLDQLISASFRQLGRDESAAWRASEALVAIQELAPWRAEAASDAATVLEGWLADEGVRRALQVHRYQGVEWFGAEAYAELVTWASWVAAIALSEQPEAQKETAEPMLRWVTRLGSDLRREAVEAGYRVDRLPRCGGLAERSAGRQTTAPGPERQRESATPTS